LKRSPTIIVLTTLLAIVCLAVPLSAMLYLAWLRAVSAEQAILTAYARTAAMRARNSLTEISNALHALDPLPFPACSEKHITRMRQLTMNTRSIEEIGYYDRGVLACTSWGRSDTQKRRAPIDFTLPDDLQVSLRVLAPASQGNPMVAFQYHAQRIDGAGALHGCGH